MTDAKLQLDPPTYTESVSDTITWRDSRSSGQKIVDQLTSTRAQHIASVVESLVLPVIQRRAEHGMSHTRIALIPADGRNPPSAKSGDGPVELLGLANSDDEAEEIQLEGDRNNLAFWLQPGVIQDLQMVLKNKLAISYGVMGSVADQQATRSPADQSLPVSPTVAPKSRGFFFSRRPSKQTATPTLSAVLSTASISEPISAQAGLDEVCMRTISQFGLYETFTRRAILIRVTVRC